MPNPLRRDIDPILVWNEDVADGEARQRPIAKQRAGPNARVTQLAVVAACSGEGWLPGILNENRESFQEVVTYGARWISEGSTEPPDCNQRVGFRNRKIGAGRQVRYRGHFYTPHRSMIAR
jgi:hypothetical protein